MKKSIFILLGAFIVGLQAFAQSAQPLPTLETYLRTTPIHMIGRIQFDEKVGLFHDDVGGVRYLDGYLEPKQDLNIQLSRTVLYIESKKGLRVSLAGVPVTITSLKYNNVTKLVDAHSKVLGIDAGDFYIEKRIAQEIETRFGPKLQRAFERLLQIRQQRSVGDAGRVLNEMINVFKNPPQPGKKAGKPLPTFSGELTIVADVPKNQTVNLGKVVADLTQGDQLFTTILVRVPKQEKLQIQGMIFTSRQGILMHPPTGSTDGLAAILLRGFSARECFGFELRAEHKIDGTMKGAGQALVGLAWLTHQRPPAFSSSDAPALIQQFLNAKINNGLGGYIRTHQADLLNAGLTPALLKALADEHASEKCLPY